MVFPPRDPGGGERGDLESHHRLPMTQTFGTRTLSSSDGQRFPVKGKSINARRLSRCFVSGRGPSTYSLLGAERVLASTRGIGIHCLALTRRLEPLGVVDDPRQRRTSVRHLRAGAETRATPSLSAYADTCRCRRTPAAAGSEQVVRLSPASSAAGTDAMTWRWFRPDHAAMLTAAEPSCPGPGSLAESGCPGSSRHRWTAAWP